MMFCDPNNCMETTLKFLANSQKWLAIWFWNSLCPPPPSTAVGPSLAIDGPVKFKKEHGDFPEALDQNLVNCGPSLE